MAKKKEIVAEGESQAKAELLKIIEVYKDQNPVKYALKKAELEKKLAAL